jgi:hypothetical protein
VATAPESLYVLDGLLANATDLPKSEQELLRDTVSLPLGATAYRNAERRPAVPVGPPLAESGDQSGRMFSA